MRAPGRAARAAGLAGLLCLLGSVPSAAQSDGAIAGTVRDAASGRGLAEVLVLVDDGRRGATSDTSGAFRIRQLRSGSYRISARRIGYQPVVLDGVLVRAGETTPLVLRMTPGAVQVEELAVEAARDTLLDPLATATEQKIDARALRTLPVSSLDEALALSAGAVGESYRGGRLGEQAFILDGLGVKNQLDASTGGLGLRLPPDILTEASLVTNGFSARYGQAISGLVNVVTRDGGERWSGRAAWETDRPLGGRADLGLDRFVVRADGPVAHGVRALLAADLNARLDFDPVNAPVPSNALDPRSARPAPLPHNSGEQYSLAGKVTADLGRAETLRLFALRSIEQRLLYDPAYKYDADLGPARRTAGTLLSAQLQHASGPAARVPVIIDLRAGWYDREFARGTLDAPVDYALGAFTGQRFHVLGEAIARAQDTLAAQGSVAGFGIPVPSVNSPWGVPAFFTGGASRGEIAWNRFRELRGQLDATIGLGERGDLYVGGALVRQDVRTFQRVLAYLPAGDSVPAPSAARFTPLAISAYLEGQWRLSDVGISLGARLDRFDTRADLRGRRASARTIVNPRFAVSAVVKGATIIGSFGSFAQAPDYQYAVDAAFDDTTRTGRFRQGNPDLGFERAWQGELSLRGRPAPGIAVRLNFYVKRLDGLVASVPFGTSADSSIFGNADYGTVRGGELIVERELRGGWGARLLYSLMSAQASSSNAFLLRRLATVDPVTGDTIPPARIEFPLDYDRRHALTLVAQGVVPAGAGPRLAGHRILAGLEGAVIARVASGLPYTPRGTGADTLLGPPNDGRLPWTGTLDLLVRRPIRLGGTTAGLYLDARNLLNRRNVIAVRRDTGTPFATGQMINDLAEQAYAANPQPIPYESPRYRAYADRNHDGVLAGREELLPLYLAAAEDFARPIFYYGVPRLVRFGVELSF